MLPKTGSNERDFDHIRIVRASGKDRTIQRASAPTHFREESEVKAAYEQVGYTPDRNTKSWYRDIYEFYQNNEC